MNGTGGPGQVDPEALVELLTTLDGRGYNFVTPTPLTHSRALTNGASGADPLRDVFGWSRGSERLDPDLQAVMARAGVIIAAADGVRSRVRVARLDGRLFAHSAYPTDAPDAVFLGPDSYRFARLLRAELAGWRGGGTLVDIGTGAGVGAIVACGLAGPDRVIATDTNQAALALAAANARHAGCAIDFVESADLPTTAIDLAIANPPFLVDEGERAYRHGGAMRGCGVAFDMATAAMARLTSGGRLILYTGSPIVAGRDDFATALADAADAAGCTLRYEEIDPDIFGEELDSPAYARVERIALVAAIAVKA